MIPGIDVSKWQGEINWLLVKDAGIKFAGIRASVGNYYNDYMFEENYDACVNHGIMPIPYHVLRPDNTIASQWDKCLSTLDGRKPPTLVLDVEVDAGMSAQIIRDRCYWVLRHMGDCVGEVGKVIIYTGAWFWDQHLSYHVLPKDDGTLPRNVASGWHLWVAHYYWPDIQAPKLPLGWREKDTNNIIRDWSVWQHSNKGSIPGIAGDVDLDWMREEFFNELGGVAPPPTPELEQRVGILESWRASIANWLGSAPDE